MAPLTRSLSGAINLIMGGSIGVVIGNTHLLVLAPNDMEAIPRLMQLVAGRTGQEFNQRRNRKGVYWEKRYSATAVQTGEHLVRCLLYIDFHPVKCRNATPALAGFHQVNMTRAGVVKHPQEWEHCGYHEINKQKSKFRIIDRDKLCSLIEIKLDNLPQTYERWVNQMLEQEHLGRESVWSSDFAVGDETFVRKIFKLLGFPTRQPNAVHEEVTPYGDFTLNELEWKVY